jgi:D-glycero-D-manno-heptose 1,7-bisphosphate phosphatase
VVTRRCVFLDRDGTINAQPPAGDYVRNWEQFRFVPGIIDWIRIFNTLGLLVIVVTNQRGVARGLMSQSDLDEIHRNMIREAERCGARIDAVLYCAHDEASCTCRKPKPGLVLEAQARWNIDLAASLLIGDSDTDRDLAAVCGMNFVRVSDGCVIETIAFSQAPAR